MCDLHEHALQPLEHDEWVLDTPLVRGFIESVRSAVGRCGTAAEACRLVEPDFRELLADPDWLPSRFQEDAPESGMGGGIGQWLLFRAAERDLCLFSLVVPPGSMTPVHDHLAWGLVGLYKGNQDEEFTSRARVDCDSFAGVRCSRATTTRCFPRVTTCTAFARPPT